MKLILIALFIVSSNQETKTKWLPKDIVDLYNEMYPSKQILDPELFLKTSTKEYILKEINSMSLYNFLFIVVSEIDESYLPKDNPEFKMRPFIEDVLEKITSSDQELEKTFVLMFTLKTRKFHLWTGAQTRKKFTDQICMDSVSYIKSNLRSQDYDNAFYYLFNYLNIKFNNQWTNSEVGIAIFLISLIAFFVLFIIFAIYQDQKINSKYKKYQKLEKRIKTIKEVEKLQNFKQYYNENCVICLEPIIRTIEMQKKEKQSTQIKGTKRYIKINSEAKEEEREGILECGHSFHYKCIQEWFKHNSYCPICKNNFDQDKTQKPEQVREMLLDIQQQMFRFDFTIGNVHGIYEGTFTCHPSSYYASSGSGSHSTGRSSGFGGSGGAGGGW